jgi:acyl dehydratase
MGLDHSVVGQRSEPEHRSWDSKDALLYAVGVGAGLGDPLQELQFTTENSEGIEQQVLPTFGVLLAQPRTRRDLGDFDRALLVHAQQSVELHRPLPVAGTLSVTSTVTGIYDKGSGALVVTENVGADPESGEPLVTARGSTFIRGEGGFGGPRGTEPAWERPDRAPDYQVVRETRPEQALLYRLSGDRNPLHADPKFAARGGFGRPILHGLCTYGVTGRALLGALCDGDPARFASMSGRFSRPVLPGEPLTVSIWLDRDGGNGSAQAARAQAALFQTAKADGTVVIDRGRMEFRPAPVTKAHIVSTAPEGRTQ